MMLRRPASPPFSTRPDSSFIMGFGTRIIFSGLLALSAVGAPIVQAQEGDLNFANGIAAIVEHKVITIDDVRREIMPRIPSIQAQARTQQEYEQMVEALQDDLIQSLIDRVLIVKEFYKTKDGQPPRQIPASYIDNAVADSIISDFDGDRSKFLAYLRGRGMTMREYRIEVTEDIINSYMRSEQRQSASIISPVRVEQYYNENSERFYQEDEAHMRMIVFNRTSGVTDEGLLDRARNVHARLDSGESFADIARDVSEDTRRARGGDWSWQRRTDLKDEFSEPLFALDKGQATQPILLPEGCYILYVEDRRYAGIKPIDDVREQIELILSQTMARQAEERWLERLRRNGYVKLY